MDAAPEGLSKPSTSPSPLLSVTNASGPKPCNTLRTPPAVTSPFRNCICSKSSISRPPSSCLHLTETLQCGIVDVVLVVGKFAYRESMKRMHFDVMAHLDGADGPIGLILVGAILLKGWSWRTHLCCHPTRRKGDARTSPRLPRSELPAFAKQQPWAFE